MQTITDPSMDTTAPRKREQRGERKRKRWEATQARHAARRAEHERLSKGCDDDMVEFARRWDNVYQTGGARSSITMRMTKVDYDKASEADQSESENQSERNGCKVYKDRHLLRRLLPELMREEVRINPFLHLPPFHEQQQPRPQRAQPQPQDELIQVLELGCGTGSTTFPILRAAYHNVHITAVDISPVAIRTLKQTDEYKVATSQGRLCAHVCDITDSTTVLARTGEHVIDYITCIWTLSALSPAMQRGCVGTMERVLKRGGVVFVRDFAVEDMRQRRFVKEGRVLNENDDRWCIRGDGTYAYFLSREWLVALFEDGGRFVTRGCDYEERDVVNRREGVIMKRRWITARFVKT